MKHTPDIRRRIISHHGKREMFIGNDDTRCWVSPTDKDVTVSYTKDECTSFGLTDPEAEAPTPATPTPATAKRVKPTARQRSRKRPNP